MFIPPYIPPPIDNDDLSLGDFIDSLESFSKKDGFILLFSLILGWITMYISIGVFRGFNSWGIYGISFICGNFLSLVYYWIFFLIVK